MKKVEALAMALLCLLAVQAKTYTLNSGKWNDPKTWGDDYAGPVIKAGDVVIIKGHVTLNIPLVVEGTLQVEKGASLVGMKDLYVAKQGTFVNRGNTVVRTLSNEGTVHNYLCMEAMNNIGTSGSMENNSYMLAGNDFTSTGGNASGRGGRIYANNEASVSASTQMSLGLSILSIRKKD
jgi:hypothetical protein